MPQCQFVYRNACENNGNSGGRCKKEGKYCRKRLCELHRKHKTRISTIETEEEKRDHSFPRIFTDDEERKWVDEARKRTSIAENVRVTCVVCGRLTEKQDVVLVGEFELLRMKDLLRRRSSYQHVPDEEFAYGVGYSRLNGLVLDRKGFLKDDETGYGVPIIVKVCKGCHEVLHKKKLPAEALANNLWTGAGHIDVLSGLTWVEEKLISRVHVSVQVQKCRLIRNWRWDAFYPQAKVKGHIITYPADPTATLYRLPLRAAKLVQLVKVVFLTKHRLSLQEASKLKFFLVRRDKVFRALEWLKAHNPLYNDVELDHDALEELPVEGIVPEVYNCITFCNEMREDAKGHSRYDVPDSSGTNERETKLLTETDDEVNDDIECENVINSNGAIINCKKFADET